MRVAHPAAKIVAESIAKFCNFRNHAFFMIFRTSFLVSIFSVPEDLKSVIPERADQKQKPQAAPEEDIAGFVHEAEGEIHGPNRSGDFEEEQGGADDFLHAAPLREIRFGCLRRSPQKGAQRYPRIVFTVKL
jgi:hypothetical protein